MDNVNPTILKGLLGVIWEISDVDFQYRIWIEGSGPEVSSFTEAICGFFDDFNAKELVDHPKAYSLSPLQHLKLSELYNALRAYSDDTPGILDIEVVQDPQWYTIRNLAKETLLAFDFQKNS